MKILSKYLSVFELRLRDKQRLIALTIHKRCVNMRPIKVSGFTKTENLLRLSEKIGPKYHTVKIVGTVSVNFSFTLQLLNKTYDTFLPTYHGDFEDL